MKELFGKLADKPRRALLLLIFLCIVCGILAHQIPIGYLPRSTKKSILITLEYRGAFEREIERVIVEPLETNLSAIRGITEIFAVCEKDRARLLLTFSQRTDLDSAFLSVREIVQATRAVTFPTDVQRPLILKSDPAGVPVFVAGFPMDGSLSKDELKGVFENVDGSGEVEVAGSGRSEVVIRFDPQKLRVNNTEVAELIHMVRSFNVIGGFGGEAGPSGLVDSRFRTIDGLRDLMISRGIRLREVADVTVRERRADIIGRVNGSERLILYVQPEGDAEVLALCSRLERVSRSLPDGQILYSYGRLVRRALLQVLYAAGVGAGCVMLLTFLFMRRFLSSLLLSASIPFSVGVSLALLRVSGEELNILSLSGVAAGVGLVIDAGVVFVDEFFRSGNRAGNAIRRSRGPILFAAATTTGIFLPLLFAPQTLIDQFRGLALSIAGSVAASCIYVFLFLPAFLQGVYGSGPERSEDIRQSFREIDLQPLMRTLNRYRWPLTASGLALLVVVSVLMTGMDTEELGRSGLETEVMRFSVEYPSGYTAGHVLQSAGWLEKTLAASAGVEQVSSRYERERASFLLKLEHSNRREQLLAWLESQESRLGEAFLFFPDGASGRSSFSVSISGEVPGELKRIADQLAREIRKLPNCSGIVFHFKDALPAKEIRVDLQKTVRASIAPDELRSQMYWALSSPVVDKWTTSGDELDIVFETGPANGEAATLSALLEQPCPPYGLPIGTLVHLGERTRGGRIFRLDRARSLRLSVHTEKAYENRVLEGVQSIVASFSFPPAYRAEVGVEVRERRSVFRALYIGLAMAIVLVFLILMFQFESLKISAVVLLQIPGAFIFPLLLLEALSWPLSLPVFIGLILTSGIVVNNGILVFADLRNSRITVQNVCEVLSTKLRPILLSALTTIAGVAPLLLAGSINRGILAPLSVTMAVGIAGSIVILIGTLSIVAAKR